MTRETNSVFRRVLGNESGAAIILVATGIFALVGFGALAVDVGYLYSAQRELQASANAAALAAARDIGVGGTPLATATSYSSVTGNKNANPNFTLASITSTLFCFNTGGGCTTNQTPATSANGIQVKQQATVPLYFGRIFGMSSVQLSATAVALAAGGVPHPLNVMFIIDTTASMNGSDPKCFKFGSTREDCAQAGVQTLLGELWPCASNLASCGTATNGNVANPVDEVGLMVFPPVENTIQAQNDYNCSGTNPAIPPSYAGVTGKTSAATAAGSATLHFSSTPAFNTGTVALATDISNPLVIPAGTYITAVTGTTATMSANATGVGVKATDTVQVAPLYQIVQDINTTPPTYGLASDYRTSDTAATLNASSNIVKAVGGASGCPGVQAPGGLGTYYAAAITAAQSALTANARSGATNVIVLVSDGDASSGSMGSLSASNQCKQAVSAAQNAAKAGTWVYSIAYGASSPSCSTDSSPYNSSCYTMSQIANVPGTTAGTYVNDPTKFYSDNANGCKSTANPNITALNAIFQSIGYSLSTARLLPPICYGASPPNWC
jgi:Flp pilus assembly protein TadG